MTDEGAHKVDLSGATLYDVENKSLAEICDEFNAKVEIVRARKDPALEKTRQAFLGIPYFALNGALRLISFLSYTLNLDLRRFGIPQDPFGSIMITNIGSLGLDTAYVPLVPYSRVPILWSRSARCKDVPVVEDGQVVPGKVMRVNATFDHRFIDGFHASVDVASVARNGSSTRTTISTNYETRFNASENKSDFARWPRRPWRPRRPRPMVRAAALPPRGWSARPQRRSRLPAGAVTHRWRRPAAERLRRCGARGRLGARRDARARAQERAH